MPSVLDVILMIRKLLHILEIITISDAKYCWYEWTEGWSPSMAKEDTPSPK
jgi:hypothetical protein